eukprot:jgi/Botrbrau1/6821/Bobra.0153s0016.1
MSPLTTNLELDVDLNSTILDFKKTLQAAFEGSPSPDQQRLVYAGALCKDDSAHIKDILPKVLEQGTRYTFFLALKAGATQPPVNLPATSTSSVRGATDAL